MPRYFKVSSLFVAVFIVILSLNVFAADTTGTAAGVGSDGSFTQDQKVDYSILQDQTALPSTDILGEDENEDSISGDADSLKPDEDKDTDEKDKISKDENDKLTNDDEDSLENLIKSIKSEPTKEDGYKKAGKAFEKKKEKGIKIFCKGQLIDFSKYNSVEPVNEKGRVMVPVRAVSESLGTTPDWDQATKAVTIKLSGKIIQLKLNSNIAVVDGKNITIDVPAKLVNNRLMVPLRFINENFNKKVNWYPYSTDINIVSIND